MNFVQTKPDNLLLPLTPLPPQGSMASKEDFELHSGDDLVIKIHDDTWAIYHDVLNPVELQFQTSKKLSVHEVMPLMHEALLMITPGVK